MRKDDASSLAKLAGITKLSQNGHAEVLTRDPVWVFPAEVAPQPVRWLWPSRIPLGKLTIIDGDPGLGKSLLTVDLAARISAGSPMPDLTTSDVGEPAGVALISAEDDVADTIRPRLEAAGAHLDNVVIVNSVRCLLASGQTHEDLLDLSDLETLREILSRGVRAVFIDPLTAFLPSQVDTYNDRDIRRILAPLARLAAEFNAAIILIRHLNKSRGDNPLYRGGGSIGIIAATRAGLLVARDPEDQNRRILAVTKSNLAREAQSLAFRIEETPAGVPRLEWVGPSHYSATQVLAASEEDSDKRTELAEAASFLCDILRDGPVEAKRVLKEARALGISQRTIERARSMLRVRTKRVGGLGADGHWVLELAD